LRLETAYFLRERISYQAHMVQWVQIPPGP
jgi:hypothetical protein